MKTPKTLLTNLMKTTLCEIGLTDLNSFYDRLRFLFFGKRHIQDSTFVNSGNCFLVHGFGQFEAAFESGYGEFAACESLVFLLFARLVVCRNGQVIVFHIDGEILLSKTGCGNFEFESLVRFKYVYRRLAESVVAAHEVGERTVEKFIEKSVEQGFGRREGLEFYDVSHLLQFLWLKTV